MDGWTGVDKFMQGRTGGYRGGRVDGWLFRQGWMGGYRGGREDGWLQGWMGGCRGGRVAMGGRVANLNYCSFVCLPLSAQDIFRIKPNYVEKAKKKALLLRRLSSEILFSLYLFFA